MARRTTIRRNLILMLSFTILLGLLGAQVAATSPEFPGILGYITVADADNATTFDTEDDALSINDSDNNSSVVEIGSSLAPYDNARYVMHVMLADSDGVDDIDAVKFIFSHCDTSEAVGAIDSTVFADSAHNKTKANGDALALTWTNANDEEFAYVFDTDVDGSDTTYSFSNPSTSLYQVNGDDIEDTGVIFNIPFTISKVADNKGYWFLAAAVIKNGEIVASSIVKSFSVSFYGEVTLPVVDPGPTILSWYDAPAGMANTDEASLKTLEGFNYIANGSYARKAATTAAWLDSIDNQSGSTHVYTSDSAETNGVISPLMENRFRFRIADSTTGTYANGVWIGAVSTDTYGSVTGLQSAGYYKGLDAGTSELGESGGCKIWLELADTFDDNAAFEGRIYFFVTNYDSIPG